MLATLIMPKAASDRDEHPLVGSVLRGTYSLRRVLDRGGLGVVFEAEHLRIHRRVVVKILARHLLDDEQALARFNREAEIVSLLEHPNVVQIVDFDTTEAGEPYLVMEYLTGRSLAAVLAERGQLDAQEVARLVYQAASGLAAAHRAAIVHRDLKPANVFIVDLPDEGRLVKLLDFGISRRVGKDTRLTGEHDVLGDPQYVAPEQALGQASRLDPKSDQYSLAVIAYEAIAGHPPFLGNDAAEVLERVIANEPVPLVRFAPEAPRAVGAVLRQALAKDPVARFADVLSFASALLSASGCNTPAPGERALPPPRHDHSVRPVRPSLVTRTQREQADTEPPPAPRPQSVKPLSVAELLDQAREAFGLGDVDLAVNYVESALALADRLGNEKDPAIERASVLIDSVLRSRLGSSQGRLRIRGASSEVSLLPEQAFLLSRLEGYALLEEILDLSPLPTRTTLRHLVALLRQGVLALD